jgi:hypothetical protein
MDLTNKSANYVEEVVGSGTKVEAKLWNSFNRITLVQEKIKERLTLDLGLSFSWNEIEKRYDHIVIAELKQENVNRESLFYSLMKKHEIRPSGMSKYCVGVISLFAELKYNVFKEKLLLIEKLG